MSAELGEYLESKGADSSLRNEYGLAAREGLEPKEAVVSMTDGRGAEHAWGSRRSSAAGAGVLLASAAALAFAGSVRFSAVSKVWKASSFVPSTPGS